MRVPAAFRTSVLLLSLPCAAVGQTVILPADSGRTLVAATGQARQTLAPDRATLMIMIDAQAMSIDEAASRLGTIERAVLDTLRRLNLGTGAVQPYNSGVAPFRQQGMSPSMMGGPSFSGRSVVRVELSRLDQLGVVTSAALAKGAAFIAPPVFAVSSADSVRRALLPRALESARRDAEAIAAAAGGRLGRLVDVNAPQQPGAAFAEQNQQVFFNSMFYDSSPRTAPSSSVTTTVTGRWILVPNR